MPGTVGSTCDRAASHSFEPKQIGQRAASRKASCSTSSRPMRSWRKLRKFSRSSHQALGRGTGRDGPRAGHQGPGFGLAAHQRRQLEAGAYAVADANLALDRHALRLQVGAVTVDRAQRQLRPRRQPLTGGQTPAAHELHELEQAISAVQQSGISAGHATPACHFAARRRGHRARATVRCVARARRFARADLPGLRPRRRAGSGLPPAKRP